MKHLNIVHYTTVVLILIFVFGKTARAQVHGTANGTVHITGVWNDSTLVAISHELEVTLNYETAELTLRLDKSSLKTGIDSLDHKLSKLKLGPVLYQGKLDIDQIITTRHPPQNINVTGYLTCGTHYEKIDGKGVLEHTFGEIYACVLRMTFHLNLNEIDLGIDLPGLADEIQVEIVQSVLNKKD